ncbi:hypothetical protein VTK56DRAFT_6250 [Thermocarpiscus australiensis]
MAGPSGNPSSLGGHGGAATGRSTGGHGHEDPTRVAFFAQRQILAERVMTHYAAGLCGLIAVFVVFRWTHWLWVKVDRSKRPAGLLGRPFVASSRLARNLLVR